MLTVRRMQQLIALSRERNFTRAASALGMTQPALSRAVASLENESGLILFERSATGTSPTPAGEALISEAQRILSSVELAEHNVRMRGKGDIGHVSLAVGPLAATSMLAKILSSTLEAAPNLSVTAVVRVTSALINGVLDGSFDFGICSANTMTPNPEIEVTLLTRLQMGIFVRHGHPLLELTREITWEDLLAFPRMSGRFPTEARSGPVGTFGPLERSVECNDFEVLRITALQTDAIWLTARVLAESSTDVGRFVELHPMPVCEVEWAELLMVRQTGRVLSPAAERVIKVALSLAS